MVVVVRHFGTGFVVRLKTNVAVVGGLRVRKRLDQLLVAAHFYQTCAQKTASGEGAPLIHGTALIT